MSEGEEARECGSGGLWTLRGGVKVGAGGKVKTVSPFEPQFTFTHTGNHLQFQLEACNNRNVHPHHIKKIMFLLLPLSARKLRQH